MPIEIETLQPHHRNIMLEHLSNSREMSLSSSKLETYVQWRYFERGAANSIIALNNRQCVAFIDSQFRDYHYAKGRLSVQESSEWYCVPKYRQIGLGVSVLKKLMEHDAPILSVRGTEASQQLLQKLNWQNLQPVTLFSKMINFKTRLKDFVVGFSPPKRNESFRLELIEGNPSESELAKLAVKPSAELKPQLATWELAWFNTAPEVLGRFIWTRFELESRFAGYALSRLYQTKDYLRAQIIHIDCLIDEPKLLEKMISLLTLHLKNEGAIRIMARGSSESFSRAMRESGFKASVPQPVFWWDKIPARLKNDAIALTNLRGDDSIRPLSVVS